VSQWVNQCSNESVSESLSQPVSQWGSQWVGESISEAVSQSVIWCFLNQQLTITVIIWFVHFLKMCVHARTYARMYACTLTPQYCNLKPTYYRVITQTVWRMKTIVLRLCATIDACISYLNGILLLRDRLECSVCMH